MSISKFDIEKFTWKNDFSLWKVKMRALLTHNCLQEALLPPEEVASGTNPAKVEENKRKAHSAILLCLGDKPLREVSKEKTALDVWNKLERLYQTKSVTNKLYLKQKLQVFKMREDKSLNDQLDEFNRLVDDLEEVDVNIDDEDKSLMLLNSLPKSLENFKDALLFGRQDQVDYEDVQTALKTKFLQIQAEGKKPAEGLNVKFQKQKGSQPKKKAGGKGKKGEGKSGFVEKRKCFICHKVGHLRRDCPEKKNKKSQDQDGDAAVVEEEGYDSADALMASQDRLNHEWVLDSGCTFHMCPNESWFLDLEKSDGGLVLLGNDKSCRVKGSGTIKIKMFDGVDRTLSEVRFVPDLKRNLISLGTLNSKGCEFKTDKGLLSITKSGKTVMRGIIKNGLYTLIGRTVTGSADVIMEASDVNLWHKRLAHVGEQGLVELSKQGAIPGQKIRKLGFCDKCVLGKSKKHAYQKGKHTTKEVMDYIHSDVWGPARVSTHGGGRYFLTLIDDYSRKVWVYILKQKSDAFSKFKEWLVELENKKGRSIKHLRTDNGLEFLSEEFNLFCRQKGITRHKTVPSNPQQNGLAERMNRTLLERVRCMLSDAGLPKSFWGEAVNTAAYLINKVPSSALNFKTPDEVWYGKISDYSKLKVFGCQAYVHVKQDKLEPRALRCIFIGYPKGVKGYKLWCLEPGNQKSINSRDVVFNESQMGNKPGGGEGGAPEEVDGVIGDPITQVEVEPASAEEGTSSGLGPDSSGLVPEQVAEEDGDASGDDNNTDEEEEPEADLRNYSLTRDRSRRQIHPPVRYGHADLVSYALVTAEAVEYQEPRSFKEAIVSEERESWITAMAEEMESLKKNQTWILVNKKPGQKLISCKWLFKRKLESGLGSDQVRFKARLVARGFTQREGIDYNEVFSPVVKHCSIRLLLSRVVQDNLELQQLDVKTTFLHGDLIEELYMQQPEGFVEPGTEGKVCLLKKSLYGLKQSPRQWHRKFNEVMLSIGFVRSRYDTCVYLQKQGEEVLAYLLIYVDDMLIASKSLLMIQSIKKKLSARFDMKDLGDAKRILGMDILRDRAGGRLFLSQTRYIEKVLKRFNMHESRPVLTPLGQQFKLSKEMEPKSEEEKRSMMNIPYASGVGSLMYALVCSRPDLAYALSMVSRYMSNPGRLHWEALKWVFRYLKGSSNLGLMFEKVTDQKNPLVGYVDSDFAANLDTRRSLTGYVFTLYNTAVSWRSVLQSGVALSTTEAEFVAVSEAVKEALWLKGIIRDFGIHQKGVVIHCDNQSAVHLVKHQVFHERSKHIDVRLHFVREIIDKGVVQIQKISTDDNAADMCTKSLPGTKFKFCVELVKMDTWFAP